MTTSLTGINLFSVPSGYQPALMGFRLTFQAFGLDLASGSPLLTNVSSQAILRR